MENRWPDHIDGPCWLQATNTTNGWVSEPWFLPEGYWHQGGTVGNVVYKRVEVHRD